MRLLEEESSGADNTGPSDDDGIAGKRGMAKDSSQSTHWSKEQARQIRNHLYRWVVRPYIIVGASLATIAMFALIFGIYATVPPGWCGYTAKNSPPVLMLLANSGNSSWPFAALILGDFRHIHRFWRYAFKCRLVLAG